MKLCAISLFVVLTVTCLFLQSCNSSRYNGLEKQMHLSLDRYGNALAKKNNMKLLIVGDVTDARKTSLIFPSYCLSLFSKDKTTLDEGRVLAARLVEEFWDMLKQDVEVKKYAQVVHEKMASFPLDVPLEKVGYKISFWDQNIDRIQKPYLAEIHFYHKKFRYYVANEETQEVELIFEETYEDAITFKNKRKTK